MLDGKQLRKSQRTSSGSPEPCLIHVSGRSGRSDEVGLLAGMCSRRILPLTRSYK